MGFENVIDEVCDCEDESKSETPIIIESAGEDFLEDVALIIKDYAEEWRNASGVEKRDINREILRYLKSEFDDISSVNRQYRDFIRLARGD